MKVVFYRHTLLSRGGDKMILAHASHLAETGHHVELWTSKIDTIFPVHRDIRIGDIGTRGKIGTLLAALLFKAEADVVIADIIPLVCLLFSRNHGKVLYFAQDNDESYYPHRLQKWFVRSLYFLGLCLFKIPVVAVSANLGKYLAKSFAANVEIVENGVDTKVFFPDPDDELVHSKEDRKALVVLSRSDYRKGFDLVPQILKRVQDGSDELFEVWAVGDGVDDELGGFRSRNFGYVEEARLRRILSSADLFLYPTRHEGFGLMILESMSCRCPYVTTDAVPVAEHGRGGLVCRIEDVESMAEKILMLFQDNSMREKLVYNGIEAVRTYSLNNSQNRFEKILRSKIIGGEN